MNTVHQNQPQPNNQKRFFFDDPSVRDFMINVVKRGLMILVKWIEYRYQDKK